ncbi:TolC family protein [Cytophaga hutchinsonii]|uniref:Outer membrane lipoprotein n=1 Tax=Cytophaga hutchinsonii (strain ATCC 33406 / DSM 1761 / CIP 103989 / NBRC 15051 / NCIMB 9469 / D465) TaxID=269798 RepID=A0A6N4SNH7_CYTH3|nr:efflux transporter outer membrane subunit [Cytophaga hutchinsonii]ABG57826.1 outer membrane lipoprotein [Cytophaga hutchinsonii ATCC 33406]SFX06624.1 efflux transporter, outer membrane factor (OMF) lipoprotein, NodT family [Cytophaga hutchinsonii ATCC 33406]
MKRLNLFIYLVLAGLLYTNCVSTKQTPQAAMAPLPSTFAVIPDSLKMASAGDSTAAKQKEDSSTVAAINWREYFKDSTLIGLIDTALKNNLDIQVAYQRILVARANVKRTKGASAPFISGAVSAGQQNYGDYTQEGVGNYDTNFSPNVTDEQHMSPDLRDLYLRLETSWEVDAWGKLKNKRRAAKAKYLASVEGKNWVVTNMIAEIATTFYELLALDYELSIINETIILQTNQLSIVETQKEAGRANELAVKQFEAQVLHSKGLQIEISQRIVEAENRINYLLGRFPQPIERDVNHFILTSPQQISVGIPSNLLSNRPDIKQAEYELKASKANVKAAKAAFYPSLTITGALGFRSFNPNYFITPQALVNNIFGGLVAPLVNQSAIKASFRTAKAEQVEAMYNYQKAILNGYIEVYNQMVYINNLNRIYDLKDQEVAVLTTSIETASELFLTGRATYLEIIITRSAALQSRLELINIKKRQFNSVVNIYKALGGGWK